MIKALVLVLKWCEENDRNEFRRRDINHLLKTQSHVTRFADWVLFGGLVYRPAGKEKSWYGLNVGRARDFLAGKTEIPTKIIKDPMAKTLEKTDYRKIYDVPHIAEFLDENKEFISKYVGIVQI